MTTSKLHDFLVQTIPNGNGSGSLDGIDVWNNVPADERNMIGFACACFAASAPDAFRAWLGEWHPSNDPTADDTSDALATIRSIVGYPW